MVVAREHKDDKNMGIVYKSFLSKMMNKEEIEKIAHEVLFDDTKFISEKEQISDWINRFIENGEDMDVYWQDSLRHLIFEILIKNAKKEK